MADDLELPAELIEKERTAWQAIRAGTLTVDDAWTVHQAVVAYAAEAEVSRLDVETALKKRVRHPELDTA